MKTYTKLLLVMEHIAANGPMTPKELLARIDVPRSTLQSLLKDLTDRQWIIRTDQGYAVGPELGRLGGVYLADMDLRRTAATGLRRMADRWQCTAHLGILINDNRDVIYIDKVAGGSLGLSSYIGKTIPIHATALGKVLFSYLPLDSQNRIIEVLDWKLYTPNTKKNREELLSDIRDVHHTGIAWDREEHEIGVTCLAAPIRDFRDAVVGAMSVSASTAAMNVNCGDGLIEWLTNVCEDISSQLGWMNRSTNSRN